MALSQLPGSAINRPQSEANPVPPPTSSHATTTTQRTMPPSSHHRLSLTGLPKNFLQASIDQLTLDITLLFLLGLVLPGSTSLFPPGGSIISFFGDVPVLVLPPQNHSCENKPLNICEILLRVFLHVGQIHS
ncbi:hypothetical protein AMECASPLE_007558 [Ameca splendens]|uniref:Uncharacterized protein n=1 Tax=Ameca splendens TaxID=208324 RepID=A0ABV0XNR6_9TELE